MRSLAGMERLCALVIRATQHVGGLTCEEGFFWALDMYALDACAAHMPYVMRGGRRVARMRNFNESKALWRHGSHLEDYIYKFRLNRIYYIVSFHFLHQLKNRLSTRQLLED